jgi:hypothetical protein
MPELFLALRRSRRPQHSAELARLTSVQTERYAAPLTYGPVLGLAVLRRRMHGAQTGMIEAVDVPAFGLVVASTDGSVSWGAHNLDRLDDGQLEGFHRRALQLLSAVNREQVRREGTR